MVDVLLLKETLSETQLRQGRELLNKLDESNFPVEAAYWVFLWETNNWRLHIVSPVEDRSHHKAFVAISNAAEEYSNKVKFNFTVRGLNDSFYKHMLNLRRDNAYSNVELERLPVGNELVDLYIYRLPAPQKGASNA